MPSFVLMDFIDGRGTEKGLGLYEGMPEAVKWSRDLSNNAMRKCERYGVVPAAFISFLSDLGITLRGITPSKMERLTESDLAVILLTPGSVAGTTEATALAEYLGKEIVRRRNPELRRYMRDVAVYERKI